MEKQGKTQEETLDFIESVTGRIADPALRESCKFVLSDRFMNAPASSGHHHVWARSPLAHTAEVLEYCVAASESVSVSRDVLYTAAIWHDYAKIYEYEIVKDHFDLTIETKPYKSRIGHVVGSALEFHSFIFECPKVPSDDIIQAVQHCILAHHWRKEWGSPVEPQTIEALILHNSDMISSRFPRPRQLA